MLLELSTTHHRPDSSGHEHVKAGLILGLFGGSRPQSHSRDRLSVRTDAHILVVGDPGLGKSQMLRAVSQVAPRSVYVCANTTTASGLTVTVSKEAGGGGDVALEAGALVLSDQGVVSQRAWPPCHFVTYSLRLVAATTPQPPHQPSTTISVLHRRIR